MANDKITVGYYCGPSRLYEDRLCDCMYASLGNERELYQELPYSEYDTDEHFETLKAKIIKQAVFYHIDPDRLEFSREIFAK